MSSVQISNIRKSFGAVGVLHGVSVDIEDGEFVILVGPSGCGKSTLLRMIAGLESITGGTVSIGDKIVNDLQPKDRDIAMVFQNYALYPQMTVEKNMGFALEMQGLKKAEIKAKVENAATILGLSPLLARKPAQLSGGQRQRVAMGRAIVRDPKVFLFDEPLSNLDAKLRVQMRSEIKGLQQRLNTTTIYVTHDQIEAMTMADKIVVMQDGRVEQIGAPLELYDRPANRFVAGFLGSPAMNFLTGTCRSGDIPSLELDSGTSVRLAGLPANSDGRRVVFGIRPEDIHIDDSGSPATLNVVEPTGSETYLAIEFDGQEIMCLLRQRAQFEAGNQINISFANSAVHFFDIDSGARIN